MSELRVELQDAVERLWPDFCGGCGRPEYTAEFDVDVSSGPDGTTYITYTCGQCGIETFADDDAINDESATFSLGRY